MKTKNAQYEYIAHSIKKIKKNKKRRKKKCQTSFHAKQFMYSSQIAQSTSNA